ncbi:luciferase [Prosthecomicrobium hirschii]|uniref:Luciferase n=1 Tax=Prosthecodimorpha hirschii TaxID=665126 RepID=A0A0N8GFL6_9HYPH|nr:putative FMN-dependent luciferase-like monooxygenase [Prosthecomicrobium hirschii]KPL54665.1 luciferase [Prosthecomicrobium hirschii]
MTKRLGFFTRLLDDAPAGERYRLAAEQIIAAERAGYDSAWIAQHHFHEWEGGLPSLFPFLGFVAARTSRIRLGTGVVTLPMEAPVRVAEDAAVIDLLSGGRLEVGVGTGGTPASFRAFGHAFEDRGAVYARHLETVLKAWRGEPLGDAENRLYPATPWLAGRVWQATFSVAGGIRAGRAGDGLLLSRTQPRPAGEPALALDTIQNPIVDAYLAALPDGAAPRIMASRSLFVAEDRTEALRLAEKGLRRVVDKFVANGHQLRGPTLKDLIETFDVHVGTPDDVIESLSGDTILTRATDLVFQVHSVDPPHPLILRSIELTAEKVAPALGWPGPAAAPEAGRRVVNFR